MIATAKLFRNGASQAVRLPKECRFAGREVCIKRIGSAVLLFPRGAAWDLMGGTLGKVDADFMAERQQPASAEARKALDGKKTRVRRGVRGGRGNRGGRRS